LAVDSDGKWDTRSPKAPMHQTAARSSSQLIVTPVETWRDRRAFLSYPWKLYAGDPNWIPPLRLDQKELVGYKHHPFYETNRIQTFLARRGGEVVGRVAAILNRTHIDCHKDPRGFFGFFESVDDQEVANGLLEVVRQWFAEQGIHRLRGPTNPSVNYVWGLLVDGFDSPPSFMMPYNPSYYGKLIETCGFHKAQDLFAYWGHKDMLPEGLKRYQPLAEEISERLNLRLRPLDTSHFIEDVEAFLNVYNLAFMNMWGFSPMSNAEIRHTAASLRHLMVPELALVAEIEGRMVGAVFALPDYNPRIRRIDGRLLPFGFWRLLRKKREIKKSRILAATVLPEYNLMGIGMVLVLALFFKGLAMGMEEAEFSWVAESNSLSRGSLEKVNIPRQKTYRVYDWEA
jgi:hypothetical protein